jgi:2-polyprenyl-3-methyl-5-hydroxy-6-metoxy-1,4-benzoquinol methylase
MKNLESPLTKNKNIKFVKKINKKQIVNAYKKFNIDVSLFFSIIKEVEIYECNETGYRFYYPFNLSGDSKFYEHFQEFSWYYMPWKWEHEITLKYLSNQIKVLEVGCGQGAFIKKIDELFTLNDIVGLELNESAKKESKNWRILNQTIQNFSKTNFEAFDLVCSYQVLEHIADVECFLSAKIKCIKKGGKLIISVPNNDSYIKDADNCLNEPPHHMGLWNKKSLCSLESIFPLKLIDIHYEELQDYHVENYVSATYYAKYSSKILIKIVRKIFKIVGLHKSKIKEVKSKKDNYIGQTVMVVYQKL